MVKSNETTIIWNSRLLPGNLNFASGNAAIEAKMTCAAVATKDTNKLLNKYRKNGTHAVFTI